MYPFHHVLARSELPVRFYVVDARPMPSGRAIVYLTVLVPVWAEPFRVMALFHALTESMHQKQLVSLCEDIGVKADLDRIVSFSVLVLPEGRVLS